MCTKHVRVLVDLNQQWLRRTKTHALLSSPVMAVKGLHPRGQRKKFRSFSNHALGNAGEKQGLSYAIAQISCYKGLFSILKYWLRVLTASLELSLLHWAPSL